MESYQIYLCMLVSANTDTNTGTIQRPWPVQRMTQMYEEFRIKKIV